MNNKTIELIEHKEKTELTNAEQFILDILKSIFKYKKEIILFILGFIIGVLII